MNFKNYAFIKIKYIVLYYGVFNIQIPGKQKSTLKQRFLVVCLKEQLGLIVYFFLLPYLLLSQGKMDSRVLISISCDGRCNASSRYYRKAALWFHSGIHHLASGSVRSQALRSVIVKGATNV